MSAPVVPRTLSTAAVGEQVALTAFPFATLRYLVGDLGLGIGSIVRCLVTAPQVMLFEREDGKQIRLDSEWARHIYVESVSGSATGNVK